MAKNCLSMVWMWAREIGEFGILMFILSNHPIVKSKQYR